MSACHPSSFCFSANNQEKFRRSRPFADRLSFLLIRYSSFLFVTKHNFTNSASKSACFIGFKHKTDRCPQIVTGARKRTVPSKAFKLPPNAYRRQKSVVSAPPTVLHRGVPPFAAAVMNRGKLSLRLWPHLVRVPFSGRQPLPPSARNGSFVLFR